MTYAHSIPNQPATYWESLADHSREVADRAERFAAAFGFGTFGQALGLLHDIGKVSPEFQAYIAAVWEKGRKGPDHSTAGAREAERLYGPKAGRWIAYCVAGHHAGLADYPELKRRRDEKVLPAYNGWVEQVGPPPSVELLAASLKHQRFVANIHPGFTEAFLIRMLFSCLVDADFLATERFYTKVERAPFEFLEVLQGRVETYLKAKRRDDTQLNRLRSKVLDHAVEKAALAPGLFTLTVPTGGGKTLTSLAFALEHARRHGLRRVIYVIPYTSIIEQTADVIRAATGSSADVLEHHASFDWDAPGRTGDDDEGPGGLPKLRKASENWDAPIVVTTAVQFFESLFANRTSRCRKLHNIAGSVVVLDEAQTLPLRLLSPCMAALTELTANYRTSVVLCTATQPALRVCDGFKEEEDRRGNAPVRKAGFKICDERELAPDPEALFMALKRVAVERRAGKTSDAEIVARFAEQKQMLCIVNTRPHARTLFDALTADARTQEGARHLTTLMCPAHRRKVLAEIRARLEAGLPVRLVSTSLIEAGVDISFPEVWRAVTGIDSIAQAAGRCNREGRMKGLGRTIVFEPEEGGAPSDVRPLIEAAEGVFRAGLDPLSLEGCRPISGRSIGGEAPRRWTWAGSARTCGRSSSRSGSVRARANSNSRRSRRCSA